MLCRICSHVVHIKSRKLSYTVVVDYAECARIPPGDMSYIGYTKYRNISPLQDLNGWCGIGRSARRVENSLRFPQNKVSARVGLAVWEKGSLGMFFP